ncbi:MAG: S41 family peptidase, partial [Saprospiraceae bacterium]
PDNQNAYRMMLNMQFENRDKDKFSKVYSKQKYENDLDELAKTLTEVNPIPYKFISKEKFWRDVENKKKMISDSTSYAEFVWHCSQIVANIGCGHSSIVYYFGQEEEMLPDSLRFPLEVKLIDGRMYVSDPLVNSGKINSETEIFQINGKSTEEIKALIFPHISTQGTNVSGKRQMFNTYGSAMIAYALNFPNSYEVVLKDQKAPINLNPLKSYKHKPLRSNAVNICEDQLCLEIIDDQTALLTIKNWVYYGQRFSIFKAFIDSSFYEIEKKNIKNLVIDLRGNGGGSSDAGIYLLQHLAKKPFVYFRKAASEKSNKVFNPLENKFKGTTYFLCDGFGGSVTGHFLSIVKHLKMGLIIGEELGGNKYCTGGQLTYKLSNTDMFYCVGRFVHISESESISDERGVFPDHFISPQIKDYINDVDVELEYTLDLIDKAK